MNTKERKGESMYDDFQTLDEVMAEVRANKTLSLLPRDVMARMSVETLPAAKSAKDVLHVRPRWKEQLEFMWHRGAWCELGGTRILWAGDPSPPLGWWLDAYKEPVRVTHDNDDDDDYTYDYGDGGWDGLHVPECRGPFGI
jgi:hypothetical protein